MSIQLDPIREQDAPALRNLFQLYAHDFSEHVPLEIGADGLFDVPPVERWWRDLSYPFFIREGRSLCGFALIERGSRITGAKDVMDVAEFFVLRAARRRGIGTITTHTIFAKFPGKWEIRIRKTNADALLFWTRATETFPRRLGELTRASFTNEGVAWDSIGLESEA